MVTSEQCLDLHKVYAEMLQKDWMIRVHLNILWHIRPRNKSELIIVEISLNFQTPCFTVDPLATFNSEPAVTSISYFYIPVTDAIDNKQPQAIASCLGFTSSIFQYYCVRLARICVHMQIIWRMLSKCSRVATFPVFPERPDFSGHMSRVSSTPSTGLKYPELQVSLLAGSMKGPFEQWGPLNFGEISFLFCVLAHRNTQTLTAA